MPESSSLQKPVEKTLKDVLSIEDLFPRKSQGTWAGGYFKDFLFSWNPETNLLIQKVPIDPLGIIPK